MRSDYSKRGVSGTAGGAVALVVVVLAATLLAVWLVGRGDEYDVEVVLTNANGLEVGSEVEFRGVRIGYVRTIDVEETGVRVILGIDQHDVALTGADRFVVYNSAIGPSVLRVVDGDGPTGELPAPVLPGEPSVEAGG